MKKEKERAKVKQFHLRLPTSLLNEIKKRAQGERRSITAEMVKALEYWIRDTK